MICCHFLYSYIKFLSETASVVNDSQETCKLNVVCWQNHKSTYLPITIIAQSGDHRDMHALIG